MKVALEPKIGRWFSFCCHLDLYQITEKDLETVKRECESDGICGGVWEDELTALKEIQTWWDKDATTELHEINERIKKLEG